MCEDRFAEPTQGTKEVREAATEAMVAATEKVLREAERDRQRDIAAMRAREAREAEE